MQTNKDSVRGFIEHVINAQNLDVIADYVAEDVVELEPFPGQGPGLEGLKDVLRGLFIAFPDMHWSIEEQIGEEDKVLTRFVWTGTHRAEFLGIAATGRKVSVWGMVIDRLENGRVQDTRILMDAFGLVHQLTG
jgi:steroid delta-isomerase-like uncharacterized protein